MPGALWCVDGEERNDAKPACALIVCDTDFHAFHIGTRPDWSPLQSA